MGSHKNPRLDGMVVQFFKTYQRIVKDAIVSEVQKFFLMGNLNDAYNHTFIALISKSPNASRVDHFRPVALCNIFFKIITKTMANRLRPHLETIIHPCQSTFTPNRSITNNIIVNHEIMHYLKGKKGRKGYMAIQIDLTKAYDKVEWNVLQLIMQNFDFNDEFIKLILSCITTPHFLILLNGSPFDYFKVGRGIRQGDPCPHPYLLFIHICCLGFFPILSGIRVLRQSPKITHLMYVDDLVIYCRTFIEKVVEATKCLQTYCRWTRQDINWTKSSIHFNRNVSSQLRGEITRAMGIQECKHKGKYLGHPFCQLKNKTKAYSDILEKLKNELTRWRKISLSIAGRLVLTKAVIQSISSFTMHVMLLPKSILGKIERRSRDFLWGHSEQKKHHLYLKA